MGDATPGRLGRIAIVGLVALSPVTARSVATSLAAIPVPVVAATRSRRLPGIGKSGRAVVGSAAKHHTIGSKGKIEHTFHLPTSGFSADANRSEGVWSLLVMPDDLLHLSPLVWLGLLQLLHGHHPVVVTPATDPASLEPIAMCAVLVMLPLLRSVVHSTHLRAPLLLVARHLRRDLPLRHRLLAIHEKVDRLFLLARVLSALFHGCCFWFLQRSKSPLVRVDAPLA